MKRLFVLCLCASSLALASLTAVAGDRGAAVGAESVVKSPLLSGLFGQINVAGLPQPQTLNAKPVVVHDSARKAGAGAPIYVHVEPGDEAHWTRHCSIYSVCDKPVLIVKESWFRDVYLPHVGGQDGREQHYLEIVRLARDVRDQHHGFDED